MNWDWLPWRRWQEAERMADDAEAALADALVQHSRAKEIASESRRLQHSNGFTDAIRSAMGVHR